MDSELLLDELPDIVTAAHKVIEAIESAVDPGGPKGKKVTIKELIDIAGHCVALIGAIFAILPINLLKK